MQLDLFGWYSEFLLKPLNKTDQVSDLTIAERTPLAVANQADPDGMGVVMTSGITDHMGTWKLLIPAVSDMDLAIRQTIAITEQEVVSKALVAPAKVPSVDGLSRAEWLTKVMNDDSLPTILVERLIKLEEGVFCWTLLKVAQVRQWKTGGLAGSAQVKEQDHRSHGSKEAAQNNLGSP